MSVNLLGETATARVQLIGMTGEVGESFDIPPFSPMPEVLTCGYTYVRQYQRPDGVWVYLEGMSYALRPSMLTSA